MENAKLKTDLAALRKVMADGETGGQELLSKWFLWLCGWLECRRYMFLGC
jgi:hypothetical protein